MHTGDIWNTFKRHVKQVKFLSESKSQEDSYVAHLDCPPVNSALFHSSHFDDFKIDKHLTSNSHLTTICHPPSPPTSPHCQRNHVGNISLTLGVFFSMLDVELLYLLLFSFASEMVSPVKGQSTISPLKC